MNISDQIPFLFSCNVSPSVTPKLDIGVTKSEPLTIAVPMTIFYSIIFIFGVRELIPARVQMTELTSEAPLNMFSHICSSGVF